MLKSRLSKYLEIHVVLLLALMSLLIWVTLTQPYDNSPTIRSDGVGYHMWSYGLRDLDLSFCKYKEILDPPAALSMVDVERNVCGLKVPPGIGLFRLPFVFPWLMQEPVPGFSPGENWAILWIGAVLLVFICFSIYRALMILGCSRWATVISIGAFVFGSGLFHYATYDASFSHIYSAFGVALLLHLFAYPKNRTWDTRSLFYFMLLTLWLYMVRQTNALITLGLATAMLVYANGMDRRKLLIAYGLAMSCGILIQLAYNYYVSGEIRISSYGNERFVDFGGMQGACFYLTSVG